MSTTLALFSTGLNSWTNFILYVFKLYLTYYTYRTYFVWIGKTSTHNFADNNAPSPSSRSVKLLLEILIAESKNSIKLFSDNKMIVSPGTFKSIIIQKTINQTKRVFNKKKCCRNHFFSKLL